MRNRLRDSAIWCIHHHHEERHGNGVRARAIGKGMNTIAIDIGGNEVVEWRCSKKTN